MIVTDASAWVVALTDARGTGEAVRSALSVDEEWAAPAHCGLEVVRSIARIQRAGALEMPEAETLVRRFAVLGIRYRSPDPGLLMQVWEMPDNVSTYDAPYVALARELAVPLVTVDRRLAAAARARGVEALVPGQAA